jgi:hypothetical protein
MNSHRLQPVEKEKFQLVLAEILQGINIFPADPANFCRSFHNQAVIPNSVL